MRHRSVTAREAEWWKAWAAGDAEAVISAYADDAVLIAAGQPVFQGHPQIDDLVRRLFRLRPTVRVSRLVSRTLEPGIVLSIWRYTTTIGSRAHTATCALVWQLDTSQWKIVLHSSVPAQPGSS